MMHAMRRTRVAHVVLNLEAGGLERLVVELATRVDPSRFESHVVALQFAGRHAAQLGGLATLHVLPQRRRSMIYPSALARLFRDLAPDVVHTHSGVWYKAALAARLAGVSRVVHTDHGRLLPDRWRDRATDAIGARMSDVVIAVADPLATYLRRRLRVPAERLRVIRNGIDVDAFAPPLDRGALRRELGIALDAPVVGSFGRLDAIKGYDALIDAFGLLRRRWTAGAPPVLVIAGDGPERPRLAARVAALSEREARAIHLLGWRTDVRRVLTAFDLFAMTSHSEGTSVSLLEAMSAGVCPLVTDVGGNADVLGDDLSHCLVARGDPRGFVERFAAALRDALSPDADRRAHRVADGRRARARVDAVFGVAKMVRAYEREYDGAYEAVDGEAAYGDAAYGDAAYGDAAYGAATS